ncbi:MAG: hypothetical protein Fur0037_07620 [Planctomycetota bacterium]
MIARWICWFVAAPAAFAAAGWLDELSLPPVDVATGICLYLGLFAERSALPGLLVAAAIGRAFVDDAGLPVQVLVLGLPVALLLPLRAWVFQRRWLWQVAATVVTAFAIPQISGLLGRAFDQPSAGAVLDAARIAWAAVLVPPLLTVLRRVPPASSFQEVVP